MYATFCPLNRIPRTTAINPNTPVETLVPERYHASHAQHRSHYFAGPGVRPMGVGLELFGRRLEKVRYLGVDVSDAVDVAAQRLLGSLEVAPVRNSHLVQISWVSPDPRNPIVLLLYRVTEPVLEPIRNALPPMGGLDLSPLVLLFALRILRSLLV